jgi:hypothetical protein
MQEFMLLIRKDNAYQHTMPADQRQEFLQKVMDYIDGLLKQGNLIGAQPLSSQGKVISGSAGAWKDGPFNESKEVIAGYYHILANDLDEAIEIAKGNPEFQYDEGVRVEVRLIKTVEQSTGFVYPKSN